QADRALQPARRAAPWPLRCPRRRLGSHRPPPPPPRPLVASRKNSTAPRGPGGPHQPTPRGRDLDRDLEFAATLAALCLPHSALRHLDRRRFVAPLFSVSPWGSCFASILPGPSSAMPTGTTPSSRSRRNTHCTGTSMHFIGVSPTWGPWRRWSSRGS